MMLAIVAGGALLMFTLELLLWWSQARERPYLPYLPAMLFLPALFGALTFRQDQRRRAYRFLAEHAGRPRLVWLVRTAVWIAPVVVLCSVVTAVGLPGASWLFVDNLRETTVASRHLTYPLGLQWSLVNQALFEVHAADVLYYGMLSFWLASLAAYAVGQLASLLLRSEILAAGVALGGSVVLVMWCYLVAYWRLPPVWCIGPIAAGAFFASWLRAPDWLVDRHSATRWTAVVAAVVLPIAAVAFSIPALRVNQMSFVTHWQSSSVPVEHPDAAVDYEVYEATGVPLGPLLREAVDQYEEKMKGAEETTREYQEILSEIRGDRPLIDAYPHPLGKLLNTAAVLAAEEHPNQIQALGELTERPALSLEGGIGWTEEVAALIGADMHLSLADGELDKSFERYLSLQRFIGQVWQNNSSRFAAHSVMQNLHRLGTHFSSLLDWATAPNQTSDRLKKAVQALGEVEQSHYPPARQAVIADYLHVRRVVEGRELPSFVQSDRKLSPKEQMALVLNDLSWERQRALFAPDAYAGATLDSVKGVTLSYDASRRELLRPEFAPPPVAPAVGTNYGLEFAKQRYRQLLLAESSLIVALEWPSQQDLARNHREQLLAQARRSLERWRLALIAYRLDHGEYPETLRDLAPEYIVPAPLDPFGGDWFGYKPEGFDLPVWDHLKKRTTIEPGTPVIWSVGAGNASPTRTVVQIREAEEQNMGAAGHFMGEMGGAGHFMDEMAPEEEDFETLEAIVFQATESGWHSDTVVLPLPK